MTITFNWEIGDRKLTLVKVWVLDLCLNETQRLAIF